MAVIAVAGLVVWLVKLRSTSNDHAAAREVAELVKAEREQALWALQQQHQHVSNEFAVLQQSHAALMNRFRGIVDADAERQRVLAQLEGERSQALSDFARSRAEWEQALRQLQDQHRTIGAEHERLAQAHAALTASHTALVATEAELRRVVGQLAAHQGHLHNDVASAIARLQGVVTTEQEKLRNVAYLEAERARLTGEFTQSKAQWEQAIQQLHGQHGHSQAELAALQANITKLRVEFSALDEESNLQTFGFYKPRYNFASSERYQAKLEEIRGRQKSLLKTDRAAVCKTQWTVNGSASEGRKQINQTLKLILRAFNGESDAAIAKVNYKNVNVMETRIRKAWDAINGLVTIQQCEITAEYLDLKLQELYLVHEYEEKLQAEKEEQRRIKEQMREEEAALREIEKAKQEAEREEQRFAEALRKAQEQANEATGAKQQKLLSQIEELQKRLAEAHANKERAISQAQLTRSGHVYVISNLGSFGERVYKIGMTRRLDPMDRVKELGDASVPFEFDVHAMIWSQDAPALENALHRQFHYRRVNLINERKEFFHVEMDEIVDTVHKLHGEIEITKIAEAKEHRQSMALRQEREAAKAAGLPTPMPSQVQVAVVAVASA